MLSCNRHNKLKEDSNIGTISVSLPSDGTTADVADYNTPINTIVTVINGNLDNANIATGAGISTDKIADDAITPAKWTNPYCFRAYASGATTLTDATPTKVLLATESYDYNSNFASSTYTAPVAGVYNFSATFQTSALTGGFSCRADIYVNGAVAMSGPLFAPITALAQNSVSGDLLLAASDTVEFYALQNSDANETTITGSAITWFSGHLVYATG